MALQSGLLASGVSIVSAGIIPTPAISYLIKLFRFQAGAVISASHNCFKDNGIKIFSSQGIKLSSKLENKIELQLNNIIFYKNNSNLGYIKDFHDYYRNKYIELFKSLFFDLIKNKKFKIVLDCANGSTYQVAPKIFRSLGFDIIALFVHPNGYNINKDCGSVHVNQLKKIVLLEHADIGIAFDGDGDRVIMIDHLGKKLNGDHILYILAKFYLVKNKLQHSVVGTIMSNTGLEISLKRIGIKLIRVNIGDRYILKELKKKNLVLGAEESGHVIILDELLIGDPIFVSLQIIKIMCKYSLKLNQLYDDLEMFPQKIISLISKVNNLDFLDKEPIKLLLDNCKFFLGPLGRVLFRFSGTEKCIRVMIEGNSTTNIENFSKKLINLIKTVSVTQVI